MKTCNIVLRIFGLKLHLLAVWSDDRYFYTKLRKRFIRSYKLCYCWSIHFKKFITYGKKFISCNPFVPILWLTNCPTLSYHRDERLLSSFQVCCLLPLYAIFNLYRPLLLMRNRYSFLGVFFSLQSVLKTQCTVGLGIIKYLPYLPLYSLNISFFDHIFTQLPCQFLLFIFLLLINLKALPF